MIEFVGLPPQSRESYKRLPWKPCISHSLYQISFEENFVSNSEGPTEQFGMNLKDPRSAG